MPGLVEQDTIANFMRYALLFEAVAFSAAILLNISQIRRERDANLRKQIDASREKLRISKALVKAEQEYNSAIWLAEDRRERLATTAHDIQQPLSTLRIALSRLGSAPSQQLQESFDYLDDLVQASLEETHPHGRNNDNTRGPPEEVFSLAVILRNVEAMFQHEARDKNLDLRFVRSPIRVKARPLSQLRIVSNLVSNAVKHTPTGRVLVGARRLGRFIQLEVHDTGPGMSQSEIDRVMQPYERNSEAPGNGLGLALVRDLCDEAGFSFELVSRPGHGSCAIVRICGYESQLDPKEKAGL